MIGNVKNIGNHCRNVVPGVCLIALAVLAACAAAPAPKVSCDTDLRPINPSPRALP
jgi:hypothetical protein